ncbi:MAG: cation acetate symporter [Actinobacteria bacterium]|nr:cation acetate symporter [Actinomycetota bacterium]
MTNLAAILMVLVLLVVTIGISFYTRRFTRTSVDFYLAGRKIGFFTNASAICGDYFSAASFLGVAAAVYASGLDGVWYGTGFGAAFVPVVLFLASPLRRFGEYTIPDFLYARFGNKDLARIIGIIMVQLISLFYLAPQMYGAGTTWQVLVGAGIFGLDPYTTGVVVVVVVMAFYVAMGGMKGTTWNQMIQFWVLFTAMALVVAGGFLNGFSYPTHLKEVSKDVLKNTKTMTVKEATTPDPKTGVAPIDAAKASMSKDSYEAALKIVKEGKPDDKVVLVLNQKNKLHPERPMKFNEPGHRYTWFDQFSMVLALVLGTSGLPHIMNRYYTNPSGKAARLTTVWVLVFVGTFYIMAAIAGVAGRYFLSEAFLAGKIDPTGIAVDGLLIKTDQLMPLLGKYFFGQFGLGYVVAGAFAAMWSTIGGLLMASAASWGHDLYEQYINPNAPEWKKVAVGKTAVVLMALLSLIIGIAIPYYGLDKAYPSLIAMMVTWAFSVSASAFVPTLILGMWWKRITFRGALAGMTLGGFGAVFFIFMNILKETKMVDPASFWGYLGSLTFPVAITVPVGIVAIVLVSLLDKNVPHNVEEIWMRIHGTAKERRERALGLIS